MRRKRTAPEQRFWVKVDRQGPIPEARPELGPCWTWTAGLTKGYGTFHPAKGKTAFAHRYAFELANGPIPVGLQVDHLCFRPTCVRPSHLEAVTEAENHRRATARRTHCPHGHSYDRYGFKHHNGRDCRECARLAMRRRRAR